MNYKLYFLYYNENYITLSQRQKLIIDQASIVKYNWKQGFFFYIIIGLKRH